MQFFHVKSCKRESKEKPNTTNRHDLMDVDSCNILTTILRNTNDLICLNLPNCINVVKNKSCIPAETSAIHKNGGKCGKKKPN